MDAWPTRCQKSEWSWWFPQKPGAADVRPKCAGVDTSETAVAWDSETGNGKQDAVRPLHQSSVAKIIVDTAVHLNMSTPPAHNALSMLATVSAQQVPDGREIPRHLVSKAPLWEDKALSGGGSSWLLLLACLHKQ